MTRNKQAIKIGFARKPHGLYGFIKVTPLTEFVDERFAPGDSVILQLDDKSAGKQLIIEDSRWHGDDILIKFEGYEGIESVQHIRNAYLFLPAELDRLDLDEDDYYADELLGMQVITSSGAVLGIVKRLEEYPSNPVMQILKGRVETLVPFVKALVHKVDLKSGRIILTDQFTSSSVT
tara:strand:+ start:2754 stop:3287 length:534 start_codon:yes stop_codon:yes gene_type:complete